MPEQTIEDRLKALEERVEKLETPDPYCIGTLPDFQVSDRIACICPAILSGPSSKDDELESGPGEHCKGASKAGCAEYKGSDHCLAERGFKVDA